MNALGRVSIVGAGPGDPELITVRALARIRTAEVLVYDRLVDPALVAEAPPGAERVFAGKARGFAALEQHEIEALLIARAFAGKHVVRLKGGDPYVFGRGGEEVATLVAAGIPVEVVPGISSALAVLGDVRDTIKARGPIPAYEHWQAAITDEVIAALGAGDRETATARIYERVSAGVDAATAHTEVAQ